MYYYQLFIKKKNMKDDKGQNMKNLIRIFTLVITINIVFAIFPSQILAQQNDVNFQEFYDQLSPYGYWIDNPNYGYIWVPIAGPDFTPYLSNGYWVLTDYGWMWISDYNWGWATFHYGRWDYNYYYGWFWIPDNEWGPSWVTWRRSEGYYGWAPMRPGVSINIYFGSYNDLPNDRWVFVRDRDFERHDIDRNYVDRSNNITIINNSTVINKTYYDDNRHTTYVTGPGREDVEKTMGKTIKPFKVREKDKPGQILENDQLQIYRPQVQKNNRVNNLAPTKLTNIKDVKQISQKEIEKHQVVNPTNKNNTKENPTKKENTKSPNDNLNKEKQPVVNPPKNNSIDTTKSNQKNGKKEN
jgi:hypothetical protein